MPEPGGNDERFNGELLQDSGRVFGRLRPLLEALCEVSDAAAVTLRKGRVMLCAFVGCLV